MRKAFFVVILSVLLLVACRPSVVPDTTKTEESAKITITPTLVVPTTTPTSTPYIQPVFVTLIEWAEKGVLEDFLTSPEVNPADIAYMDDQKYYADFAVVMGDQRYNFVRFNTWVTGEKVLYAEVKSGKGDFPTWVRMVREEGEMEYGSSVIPSIKWKLGNNIVMEYPADLVCEGEAYACYIFYPPYYTPDIGFGKVGGYSIFSENIGEVIKNVLN